MSTTSVSGTIPDTDRIEDLPEEGATAPSGIDTAELGAILLGRWPEARGQTARRQKNRCFQGVWAVSAGGQSILTDAAGPTVRPVFRACADALQ